LAALFVQLYPTGSRIARHSLQADINQFSVTALAPSLIYSFAFCARPEEDIHQAAIRV